MTDSQITQDLAARPTLPSTNAVISEFHCGYQRARRLLEAAGERKRVGTPLTTGVLTQEDF